MKHVWVVESSGGRKWRPAGQDIAYAFFTKKAAESDATNAAKETPGLKWRVVKYARIGGAE